jgi:predicted neuraminidase
MIAVAALIASLIFPPQEKHVHSSTIVEAPNGDLIAAWFHGSGERTANDVVIQGARLQRGAANWSPVFLMADTPDLPDCNPVLFIDPQERLWLFWIVVHNNRWERSILKYRISENYLADGAPIWSWQDIVLLKPGETFSDDLRDGFKELGVSEPLWAEYGLPYSRMIVDAAKDPVKRDIGWMTRTRILALPSGRMLVPLYSDGFNVSLMAWTDDLGLTWTASKPIVGLGNIQPSVERRKNGTLVAFMRDNGPPPKRMTISTSPDDGQTWSVARETEIPNPGSSVAVLALADGRWILVLNDTERGRHRMALAVSPDEGKSWRRERYLDQAEEGGSGFGYPSAIQARNGIVHITYSARLSGQGASIKHVAIDPDDIGSGDPM